MTVKRPVSGHGLKMPTQSTAPDQATALLDMLRRRDILWQLMLGTVLEQAGGARTVDTVNAGVQLDGDATGHVTAQNISGRSLVVGGKVAVVFVPPRGYYVVGPADGPDVNSAHGFVDTGHTASGAPLGIGTTAVQIIQSDNSRTYPSDRAFRVYWRATIAAVTAVSTPVQAMILQGTNGTVLRPGTTVDTQTTTVIHQFSEEWIFVNRSGADKLNEFLSIQLKTTSGTLNTQTSATAPLFFNVDDIGPASFWPWANSMT